MQSAFEDTLPHTMKHWAFLLMVMFVAACGGESNQDGPPSTSASGAFRAVATCPFDAGKNVRCGFLEVPENYAEPEGRKIELAVAIFESRMKPAKADPVVYLAGGPGGGGLDELQAVEGFLGAVREERDLIAIDQRGTGYSKPHLSCPELDMEGPASEAAALAKACRDRLSQAGVDLAQYNTANNARDVRALRMALELEQWNALGLSYGTRLALEMMRQGSEGLRAVVLDSVLPPDVDSLGEEPRIAERALSRIFDTCAAEAWCAQTYPDLESRFYALLQALDASPLTGTSWSGIDYELDGSAFVDVVLELAYDSYGVTLVPQVIEEAEQGEAATLDDIDFFEYEDGTAAGMHFSVVCAEWLPLLATDFAAANANVEPALVKARSPETYEQICDVWDVPAVDSALLMPVQSDVPTLILAGAYDPATPPSWGEQAKKTLPQAHYSLFQGASHGVLSEACGAQMIADFLAQPDAIKEPSCMEHDEPISYEASASL